jgi:hypothetical protein
MLTVFDYALILAKLQQLAPEAHIAGGAVRDTILKKEIHDIDVFMNDKHVESAAALLRSACGYVKVGEWKQYLEFSDPAMTRVAKFEKADETIPICIIGLLPDYTTQSANVARFDFGVCMAWFDGQRTVRTPAFDDDVNRRSFTLHRADNQEQFNYSMTRYERLSAGRYQGWSVAIPDEFEAFVRERAFRHHWYRDFDGKGFAPQNMNLLKPKARATAA